ncbi:MAG: GIY-YIG nuclease family protein [Patescibacteria group bacterium]
MLLSGVYKIQNTVNGKQYIGSSVNIRERWQDHERNLRAGTHANARLQHAWNKYGADAFIFSIIELVSPTKDALIAREQAWIDLHNTAHRDVGYNISPTAGSSLGTKFSAETCARMSKAQKGKVLTEEHKRKIGAAAKGRKASDETKIKIGNGSRGRKHTEECKARIGAASAAWTRGPVSDETRAKQSVTRRAKRLGHGASNGRAKLTEEQVIEIRRLYATREYTNVQIAQLFGVCKSTIGRIVQGKHWIFVA